MLACESSNLSVTGSYLFCKHFLVERKTEIPSVQGYSNVQNMMSLPKNSMC